MKRIKRRLRLRKEIKERLFALLIVLALFGFMMTVIEIGIDRFEKIESGEMILIDHNGGDR